MKKIVLISIFFVFSMNIFYAQKPSKPKLVVGIVIDQMRYDYLYRFYKKYGDRGFKRLLKEGYNLKNTHYNYIPTYTAVGHSSIYTGTTPQNHGIIGNDWYDKFLKKSIYCVDDANYTSVGTKGSAGQKSPYRLHSTTITDQLRLSQNLKGKTISIAIKDRSAILPAGHTANAAYWFEGANEGKWISSSFYMKALPSWAIAFNKNGKVADYLSKAWNTYYPINTYTESISDDNTYERKFKGEDRPVFPHDIPKLKKENGNYSIIKSIPAGNSITTDFAIAAIKGEQLGLSKEHIDFLALSYSSTDYIGHHYGVDSKEIEDAYIRMDLEIERLLDYLDKNIGKNEYTLFLTADHAVAQTPNYLNSLNIPGGYFENAKFKEFINTLSLEAYGSDKIVENFSSYQIFLNKSELKRLKLNLIDVENFFAEEILSFDKVYKTITAHTLQTSEFTQGIYSLVQQGYNQKLSGNIILILDPSVIGSGHKKTGTTHGSGYSYDTHVPLLFFGNGIDQGASSTYYPITNIAATLANLLDIEFPNGTVKANVIDEVFSDD